MKYSTVGTIKSLNLSSHSFTLEPISKYRFETKDDDENSWKIIFKEECILDTEPNSLRLWPKDTNFCFDNNLTSAMVVLRQSRSKIKVVIEESCLAQGDKDPLGRDANEKNGSSVTNDSTEGVVHGKSVPSVEIEVL